MDALLAVVLIVIGVLAYLLGSVPFGFLIAQARGIDIREHGSGNIGATNVLRIVGKNEGITAFILDTLKGVAGVWIGYLLAPFAGAHPEIPVYGGIVGMIAVILGHNYTCFLGFKGGKGIATTGGALIALMPIVFLVALAAWAAVAFTTRYVSLGSILAALTIPITLGVRMAMGWEESWALLAVGLLVCVLAILRHKANIQRLLKGEEHRFGEKKAAGESPPSQEADS
jgi:glycerol-3-phosphate acyltransferase PlsY